MELETLKDFFMWMTVLNAAIMIFQTFLCMGFKELIARMHGRMFGISPDAIKTAIYGYLGVYKIFFIVCCLTPWLALVIMT